MKKKILIGIPTLESGGVEVSLIRFLNELVKNKNLQIDLLMLERHGIYLKDVPKEINILDVTYDDDMYIYGNKLKDVKRYKNPFKIIKYLFNRLVLRNYIKNNNWEKYYKRVLRHTNKIEKQYDLAIDWHGYGHFISTVVAEKVDAKKKAMWIHDEKNEWLNKVAFWHKNFDKFFCVGKSCLNNAVKNVPNLENKMDIFYNMTDYENVRKKAQMPLPPDIDIVKDKTSIVTVGRLEWQKGYDIAIDIAVELKKNDFAFVWYVIGGGTKEHELKELSKIKKVDDVFKFLGVIPNPFPIESAADLYVLSSRHEGYCLATLEAKILGKVIIATDILSNREQIIDSENGFLCELDAKKFACKIMEVSNNKKLKDKIINNLAKENFDYTGEFTKIYRLMEE